VKEVRTPTAKLDERLCVAVAVKLTVRSVQSLLSHDHTRGVAPAAVCRPRRQLGP